MKRTYRESDLNLVVSVVFDEPNESDLILVASGDKVLARVVPKPASPQRCSVREGSLDIWLEVYPRGATIAFIMDAKCIDSVNSITRLEFRRDSDKIPCGWSQD